MELQNLVVRGTTQRRLKAEDFYITLYTHSVQNNMKLRKSITIKYYDMNFIDLRVIYRFMCNLKNQIFSY